MQRGSLVARWRVSLSDRWIHISNFVRVCMCVYIYIYLYICVCVYIYRCKGAVSLPGAECCFQIGGSIYEFVYVCVCAYIYVCMYVCVCVCIDVKGQSCFQAQTVTFR